MVLSALALTASSASAGAEVPLPITTIGSWTISDWQVTCTDVEKPMTSCDATRRVAKHCVRIHFETDEAFAELLRNCSDDRGLRKAIELSANAPSNAQYAVEDLLKARGLDHRRLASARFADQIHYVATFMFKLTNG